MQHATGFLNFKTRPLWIFLRLLFAFILSLKRGVSTNIEKKQVDYLQFLMDTNFVIVVTIFRRYLKFFFYKNWKLIYFLFIRMFGVKYKL